MVVNQPAFNLHWLQLLRRQGDAGQRFLPSNRLAGVELNLLGRGPGRQFSYFMIA
jgi:hypothetical protein